ncbi:hypothetical protein ID866_7055 [Astraeus odoratus]|nr:hypothetical protein ID866_7055 [Astraeus odoratus]
MRRMRMSPGTEPVWSHQGRGDELRLYPGVPLTALIRLTSPNGPYPPSPFITWGRDAEVATLYSAASVVSVPGMRQSFGAVLQPHAATVPAQGTLRNMRSLASMSNASHELPHDVRVVHELPELASEAEPYNSKPDSIIPGSHGLVRAILLNDRIHALTVDTEGEVAVWDIVRGICRGRYTKQDVWDASRCGSTDSSALSRGSGSTHGDRDRSPRAALEIVRERIEGEAVISPWSSVDTKTGVLTVHINERCFEAEIYADEAGYDDKVVSDEQRRKSFYRLSLVGVDGGDAVNIGKWVLRNLFLGFIREEQRIRRRREGLGSDPNLAIHSGLHRDIAPTHIDLNGNKLAFPGRHSPSDMSHKSSLHMPIRTAIVASPFACRAIVPNLPVIAKPSALIPSMIPLSPSNTSFGPRHNPQSPLPNDRTPMPIRTQGLDVVYAGGRETDYFSPRSQRPITSNAALEGDSLGSNDLSSPTKVGPESPISTTPNTQSAGGLMGRLKNLGKGPIRRPATEITPGSPISSVPVNAKDTSTAPEEPEMKPEKTPAQIILSNPLSPPSSSEAPTINLPPDMTIMISDESYPGWKTVYRGSVSSTWADVYTLEETIPLWLLEYLLLNKTSPPLNVKLSFVLLPWPNPELGGETLPVLLNPAQSKLTASRFLRVRKLTHHVRESAITFYGFAQYFLGTRETGENLDATEFPYVNLTSRAINSDDP